MPKTIEDFDNEFSQGFSSFLLKREDYSHDFISFRRALLTAFSTKIGNSILEEYLVTPIRDKRHIKARHP